MGEIAVCFKFSSSFPKVFLKFFEKVLQCSSFSLPLQSLSKKVGEFGELAEWFKAAVLKTVEVKASGGSNPSLSANK